MKCSFNSERLGSSAKEASILDNDATGNSIDDIEGKTLTANYFASESIWRFAKKFADSKGVELFELEPLDRI